jgi:hypothetical protein
MSERNLRSPNWITQMSYNSPRTGTTAIIDRLVVAPYVRIRDTLAHYHRNSIIGLTSAIFDVERELTRLCSVAPHLC